MVKLSSSACKYASPRYRNVALPLQNQQQIIFYRCEHAMSVVAVVVDEVVVAVEAVTSKSSDLKRTATEFQTMIWMNKELSVRHENVINLQFNFNILPMKQEINVSTILDVSMTLLN